MNDRPRDPLDDLLEQLRARVEEVRDEFTKAAREARERFEREIVGEVERVLDDLSKVLTSEDIERIKRDLERLRDSDEFRGFLASLQHLADRLRDVGGKRPPGPGGSSRP